LPAHEADTRPAGLPEPVAPPQPDASAHKKRAPARRRARRRHAGDVGGDSAAAQNS
jgi:hypothetical protein